MRRVAPVLLAFLAAILAPVLIWVGLGIFHMSQTIGDIATPATQRAGITYFALFAEIPFGVAFGILGVISYIKYRNYDQ